MKTIEEIMTYIYTENNPDKINKFQEMEMPLSPLNVLNDVINETNDKLYKPLPSASA